MKCLIIFSILVVLCTFQQAEGMDVTTCKEKQIELNKEEMDHMKECAESSGIDDMQSLTREKIACMTKCIIYKKELADEDGNLHKENIKKLLDEKMPKEIADKFKEGISKCIDKHGGNLDPKAESCMSFHALGKCSHKVYLNICR